MLKYVDTMVTFSEFPNEISLCINISNCPHRCINCHSAYLQGDIGAELTTRKLSEMLEYNAGITCVGFLGGDQAPEEINTLAKFVHESYPEIKVGWYSGNTKLAKEINLEYFDYYKIGPYIEKYGPLTSPITNQRFYSKGKNLHKLDAIETNWYDVTNWFWPKESF